MGRPSPIKLGLLLTVASLGYACTAPLLTIGNIEASNNSATIKADGSVNVSGNNVNVPPASSTSMPSTAPTSTPPPASPTPPPPLNGGLVTTLAGSAEGFGTSDGQGSHASFTSPTGVVVDNDDNIYVLDHADIRKVSPDGAVSTFASNLGGHAVLASGGHSDRDFTALDSIVLDSKGNFFVTDVAGYLFKITPGGQITVFVGGGLNGLTEGTGTEVTLSTPGGLCLDADDNLYLLARGGDDLLKITPGAEVTRLLSNYRSAIDNANSVTDGDGVVQSRLARDVQGNIYVCDSHLNTIHKIDPELHVSLFAGSLNPGSKDGPRAKAGFNYPSSMVIDRYGVMYVADSGNGRIRSITSDGNVTTIAGGAPDKPNNDITFTDGRGASASFSYLTGLALAHHEGLISVEQALNTRSTYRSVKQAAGLVRTIK